MKLTLRRTKHRACVANDSIFSRSHVKLHNVTCLEQAFLSAAITVIFVLWIFVLVPPGGTPRECPRGCPRGYPRGTPGGVTP